MNRPSPGCRAVAVVAIVVGARTLRESTMYDDADG